MRLGVHVGYWMSDWADDPEPLIARAARNHCQVVELSLYSALPTRLGALRRLAAQEHVELTFTTGLQAATDLTSPDPEVRAAGIRYLERCVQMVAEAGGTLLSGVLYAPWGARSGMRLDERLALAAQGLSQVAATADTLGVDLGVEPINRYETDLVTTVERALRLVEEVGSPRVGILLDVFHAHIEEADLAAAIELGGTRIKHIHLAENHRGLPGTGSLPFAVVRAALGRIGYARRAVIEAFTRPGTNVALDTATWVARGGSGDPDENLAASIRWLKENGW